jgi:AcrR family transcriptional regulator
MRRTTRTKHDLRSEATRQRLVTAARGLFGERGYAAVGTEEIVRTAEVTRGALYHHFRDKRDLFRAVHEQHEQELVERIGEAMQGIEDPYEGLLTGTRAFLDACVEPAVIRIALIDAPAVLGWEEWREIDARYGLGLVTAGLQGVMDAGILRRQDVRPLAHLMLAALMEAAMLIAHAEDPAAERRAVEGPLVSLLDGLRA